MPLSKQSLLGVSITTSSREEILSWIVKKFSILHSPFSILQIVTPNPEQIVLAQQDEKFREILNSADIALPDGAGLVWALNKARPCVAPAAKAGPWIERISGIDFMIELCKVAADKNSRVLLYGGRGGAAGKALASLRKQYPDLKGFAEDGPSFQISNFKFQISNKYQIQTYKKDSTSYFSNGSAEIKHLVQMIRSRNIRIVFIGLGAPKQEYLIDALTYTVQGPTLHGIYSNLVVMAVGGVFDVLAGKIARAPKLVQQFGFEWLWRLFKEPWRWRRQLSLLQFILLILRKKK